MIQQTWRKQLHMKVALRSGSTGMRLGDGLTDTMYAMQYLVLVFLPPGFRLAAGYRLRSQL